MSFICRIWRNIDGINAVAPFCTLGLVHPDTLKTEPEKILDDLFNYVNENLMEEEEKSSTRNFYSLKLSLSNEIIMDIHAKPFSFFYHHFFEINYFDVLNKIK